MKNIDITTPPHGTSRGIVLTRYHDIRKARRVGRSWSDIADALGLTLSALKAAMNRVERGIQVGRIDPAELPPAGAGALWRTSSTLRPADPPPPCFAMTEPDDLPSPHTAPPAAPASPGYGPAAVLSQPPRLGILATLQKMQSKS